MTRGRMLVTFILISFTIVSARKQHELSSQAKHKIIKEHNGVANEVKPKTDQQPVDFGHIYRQGFGDIDFKQPYDALELDMVQPKNYKHAMELLSNSDGKNIQWMPKKERLIFLSPRDEMEYYRKFYNATNVSNKEVLRPDGKLKTISRPSWYDFSSLLENNLANPFANRRSKMHEIQNNRNSQRASKKQMPQNIEDITNYFQENRFFRKPNSNRPRINWTTCDEFSKNAVFHPNDVINTKWLPFFIWSKREFSSTVLHTFSYPTKKIIQHFKTIYGPHTININWNQPKLLLKERRDILLIAGDRKGLFHGVPEQELPTHPSFNNETLPTITLRMKIHDPYLAMMYCDEHYALIMAELGTEPTSEREAILEAGTLKFKGRGAPVHRDIEKEKLIATLVNKKKMENEHKKFIRIDKIFGDVDEQVKH